jgi:D-beta-D-heptose 7-phosphate kinase / D-beta-D-heptose 1-phosphate adenosyltransferase
MTVNMREVWDCSQRFRERHVLVIGDLMLDEYLWGHIERISPEAPVPILNVVRREATLGGAGNVVCNLRALGVNVTAIGVLGEDETGGQLQALIDSLGVSTQTVVRDPSRKSTRKVRLMSLEHGQQVFRMDEETTHEVYGEIENRIVAQIEEAASRADVILCSDYSKGTLTDRVLNAVFAAARKHGIESIVGPKDPNGQKYHGATILMPNKKELAQLTRTIMDGDGWLMRSAGQLMEKLELAALVVTRGKEGMSLFEGKADDLCRLDVPTMARSVYDVTGAGDTAIAALAAAVAAGGSLNLAVYLANFAAGIKVAKLGTNTVTIAEIHQHLSDWRDDSIAPINSQTAVQ